MTRWALPPRRIPSAWFNVVPHLTTPLQPPLHPATREPVGPDDLAPPAAAARTWVASLPVRPEATAYPQGKVFEAAVQFARAEGKVAAPEAAHAIRAVVDEALAAEETGEQRLILFDYSGHGFLDRSAYDDHLHGRLADEQG